MIAIASNYLCRLDGGFCPAYWSCCGDQGYCYPTEGFHCCSYVPLYEMLVDVINIFVLTRSNSNDGSFCPNGSTCVYCNGSGGDICCQGADGAIIPPYTNNNPSDTAIPTQPSNTAPSTSQQAMPTISQSQPTTAPVLQYYSTTFTYTYVVWTLITYIQSVVDSTITTTSTILSCLATDSAAAAPTLLSLASSVQSSASSSAIAASPASTGNTATAAPTVGVQTGPKSAAPERLRWNWILVMAIFIL
jgi:hypothetical protein